MTAAEFSDGGLTVKAILLAGAVLALAATPLAAAGVMQTSGSWDVVVLGSKSCGMVTDSFREGEKRKSLGFMIDGGSTVLSVNGLTTTPKGVFRVIIKHRNEPPLLSAPGLTANDGLVLAVAAPNDLGKLIRFAARAGMPGAFVTVTVGDESFNIEVSGAADALRNTQQCARGKR